MHLLGVFFFVSTLQLKASLLTFLHCVNSPATGWLSCLPSEQELLPPLPEEIDCAAAQVCASTNSTKILQLVVQVLNYVDQKCYPCYLMKTTAPKKKNFSRA